MKRASAEPARRAAEKLIGAKVRAAVVGTDGSLVGFALSEVVGITSTGERVFGLPRVARKKAKR